MSSENFGVRTPATVLSSEAARTRRLARWPIDYRSIETVALISDVLIIIAASIAIPVAYSVLFLGLEGDILRFLASGAVACAIYIPAMKLRGLYHPVALRELTSQIRALMGVWLGVFFFLAGVVFALKIGRDFSRGAVLGFAGVGLAGLVMHRIFWSIALAKALDEGSLRAIKMILISDQTSSSMTGLVDNLAHLGFQVQRHFCFRRSDGKSAKDLIADVIAFVRGSDVEEIFVSVGLLHWEELSPYLVDLRLLPLPVTLLPDAAAAALLSRPSHRLGTSVAIELQRAPLGAAERAVKRITDIVFSATGLLLLMPVLAMTALLIKFDSSGPVLFRQTRHGFNGKTFRILKFRTMMVLEDGGIVKQAARGDCRVTRVGALLRRMSIDELPQLVNVLKGDMSLVGPRPHAVAHDNYFDKLIGNYAFRHHVKPGITGWAQVHGYRGGTSTLAAMEGRVKYDTWYIDNWSILLDLNIMIRTLFEIIRGRNAY
jgi:Undecaprenyl-phosphate glucose phosphotransferase